MKFNKFALLILVFTILTSSALAQIQVKEVHVLDINETFKLNVTDEVSAIDRNYTGPVYHDERLKIVFNESLDSTKDIKIVAFGSENMYVEVYNSFGTLITTFDNIQEEELYRIFLTNMNGTDDYFELKVLSYSANASSYMEFDYVVDPAIDCSPFFSTNATHRFISSGGTVVCNYLNAGNLGIHIENTNFQIDLDGLEFNTNQSIEWYGGSLTNTRGNIPVKFTANGSITINQSLSLTGQGGNHMAAINRSVPGVELYAQGDVLVNGDITIQGATGQEDFGHTGGRANEVIITGDNINVGDIKITAGNGANNDANDPGTNGGDSESINITATTSITAGYTNTTGGNGGSGSSSWAGGAGGDVDGTSIITAPVINFSGLNILGGNGGTGDHPGNAAVGGDVPGIIITGTNVTINGKTSTTAGSGGSGTDNSGNGNGGDILSDSLIQAINLITKDITILGGNSGSPHDRNCFADGRCDGGDTQNLLINATTITIDGDVQLQSGNANGGIGGLEGGDVYSGGTSGEAGNLDITATTLNITGQTYIQGGNGGGSSNTGGNLVRPTGNLTINSPTITQIGTISNRGGNGGGVANCNSDYMQGGDTGFINIITNTTVTFNDVYTQGGNANGCLLGAGALAGDITITSNNNVIANNIYMDGGTGISGGDEGPVSTLQITTPTAMITAQNITGTGSGGHIDLDSNIITFTDIGLNAGAGDSGNVTIDTTDITGTNIYTVTTTGTAGNITINTFDIEIAETIYAIDDAVSTGNLNLVATNEMSYTEFPTIRDAALEGGETIDIDFHTTADGSLTFTGYNPSTDIWTYSYSANLSKLLLMKSQSVSLTVLPPAFTNISVTEIEILNTSKDIWLGDVVPINFSVRNDGSTIEDVIVDLRIDEVNHVTGILITNLAVGETREIQTTWNTAGFSNTNHLVSINLTSPVNSQGTLSQSDTRKVEYASDVINASDIALFPDSIQVGDISQAFFTYSNSYPSTAWEQLQFRLVTGSGYTIDTPTRFIDIAAGETNWTIFNITGTVVGQYQIEGYIGNDEVYEVSPVTLKVFPTPVNFYEDWETNSFATNGWTITGPAVNPWAINTISVFAGTYSAEASDTDGETTLTSAVISTEGTSGITLSYAYDYHNMDVGEYYIIQWYDGTTWNTLLNQTGTSGGWQTNSVLLPSGADNNPDFRIRFICSNSANGEFCKNDNINITSANTAPLNPLNLDPPTGGNLFFGSNNISWTESVDFENDDITYDLEADLGSGFTTIATGITTPYYDWNIDFFYNGTVDIRVRAVDENNATSDWLQSSNVNLDTSDRAVRVTSTYVTPPTDIRSNTTLDCNFEVFNLNSTNPIDVNVTWQNTYNNVDWNNITTYDYTYTGVTENLLYTTGVGTGSVTEDLTGTWSWRCLIEATNGEYS